MKGRLKGIYRSVSWLLVSVLLALLPLDAAQTGAVWAAELTATGSDVATMSDADLNGFDAESLPDGDAVFAEMEDRYQRSFETWPNTLIGRKYQRIIGIDDAVIAILVILLAACGLYLMKDQIMDFAEQFEIWLRRNYGDNAEIMGVWDEILVGTWGVTIIGLKKFLPILREYLHADLSGYGTDVPSYDLAGSGSAITEPGIYFKKYSNLKISSLSAPVYVYFAYERNLNEPSERYNYYLYLLSSAPFSVDYWKTVQVGNFYSCGQSVMSSLRADVDYYLASPLVNLYDYDVSMHDLISSPDFVLGGDATITITPARTWTKLQQDALTKYGDALTVPTTEAEWAALQEKLLGAATEKDVAAALAGTIAIDVQAGADDDTDVDDQVYPWWPDLSGLLSGIKDGIGSIGGILAQLGDLVTTIPETLVNLKDAVVAIPGQVVDFLTIDTTVISAAYEDLLDAFNSRFSGLGKLGDFFSYNPFTGSMEPPVFTIPMPEPFKFAYPGQAELVVMDLRPYADLFRAVRIILDAILWFGFVRWFLNEYDVKFHIG